MSDAMAAFKSGFGFGKKKETRMLTRQFPVSAPLSDHINFYEKYVKDGFAQDYLKKKGMKIPDEYRADSLLDYLQLRNIPISKAYGGKIQPRKAGRSSETK